MKGKRLTTRRNVITFLAASATWPAFAQSFVTTRQRTVGLLMGSHAGDQLVQLLVQQILAGMETHGWVVGRNLRAEVRFNQANTELSRAYAAELVALDVDIIVAAAAPNAIAAINATDQIPIVFFVVGDPIAEGLVQSYARPGGNATGFTKESGLGSKYLGLLRQVFPQLSWATMIFNPDMLGPGEDISTTFLTGLTELGIQGAIVHTRTLGEIESAVAELSRITGGGLVVGSEQYMFSHRPELLAIVDRYRVPAVYPVLEFAQEGGLIAYSVDRPAMARATGELAGRVLSGANPADIPVEAPATFVLAVNSNAARNLGLTVPIELIVIADIVID